MGTELARQLYTRYVELQECLAKAENLPSWHELKPLEQEVWLTLAREF